MVARKLFGTDGIRGVANQYPLTSEMALQVGRAVAKYFAGRSQRVDKSTLILIGKDTRKSSYTFEFALASGITSQGGNALLLGPVPTPGVAFLTKSMRADAGIMVSASHNSYEYNGIKIFGHDGFKLTDEIEAEIEAMILSDKLAQELPINDQLGRAKRIDDVIGRYIVTVKDALPVHRDLVGTRIVLDCAHGAAYSCAPRIFEELGAEIFTMGVNPNGTNINRNCGALYPQNLIKEVIAFRADIGIALDGDADRVILIDEHGEIVDGDQLLAILACHYHERGELQNNTLVVTKMSNMGLEIALKKRGINVVYTDVGDRSVVECMKTKGYNLGGEQSGHIIFLGNASTGDGLVAALNVLAVMQRSGKPLSELKKVMQPFPQVLKNVPVDKKIPFEEVKDIQNVLESTRKSLGDNGRILVRYSGTEPLCRVMVEGADAEQINEYANNIAEVIQKSLA